MASWGCHWWRDSLKFWSGLVAIHVVVDMDVILVVVPSSCELGSLLANRAWFCSIGVGGDCVCGGFAGGSVAGTSVQRVSSIHSSDWNLVRVPLRDGVSSACAETLVGIQHG